MHKFFADRDAISGNRIVLSGDDARHISFSLRMKAGEHLTVGMTASAHLNRLPAET